jgi:excisionase family DNA binding protein
MSWNTDTTFLTVAEVASFLRLSILTVYKYIQEGKLEAIELGGHYRISEDALKKFVEIHKVEAK